MVALFPRSERRPGLRTGRRRRPPARTHAPSRFDWLDGALILLFTLGMYANYTIQISAKVPFPSLRPALPG